MNLRDLYAGQKAIPYTMELTDLGGPLISSGVGFYGSNNPYVPASSLNYARSNTPLSQREAVVHSQVYGGTEPVDWLMDALNFTITAASATPIHFEDEAGKEYALKKKPNDPAELEKVDPILGKLFDMPNPYQDWELFLETTLIDWFLLGNAYWVKWGNPQKPIALYRMPPQYVRIVPDQFGPAKYLYKLPGMQQEVEYTPDQVMHFRRPNPHDPYFGVGLVKGGARAIDMELALTDTTASYYEHQATPSGVVQTERRVPRDVFNKLKSQLASFYGGSRNAGRLLVLEAGLQWTAVQASAANALFTEMGNWSMQRVLAMFNMHPALLGVADAADGSVVNGWQQLFDRKTMIPLLHKFGKAISRGLTEPGWGLTTCFEYEETQAPDDVVNRANLLAKTPGVKVKEVRTAAGLPPSTGNKDIDEMVLNLPGPNMGPDGSGGFADRNLPGEAGRPPLPQNTRMIGLGSTGPAGGNAVAQGSKAFTLDDLQMQLDHIALRAEQVKALPPANVHIGDISTAIPPEDKHHATRTGTLDNIAAQARHSIENAARALERGLLDSSEGKAEGTMYRRVKDSPAWAKFEDSLTKALTKAVEDALSMSNIHHANGGLTPAEFDVAEAAAAQVMRSEGAPGITANLKKRILQSVLKLQRSGKLPADIHRAIMDGVGQWIGNSAQNVALNEAVIAYNHGTSLVADANNLNLLVSDGEDFDDPCKEANGQVWTAEYAREHLQEHPNCRRGFVPIDRSTTLS